MSQTKLNKKSGVTLIEVLIVILLVSVIGGAIVGLLISSTNLSAKQTAIAEVEAQSQVAMQRLVALIRDADDIVTPVPDSSAAGITITQATDSIQLLEQSGRIGQTVNAGGFEHFTNNRITISGLSFDHVSNTTEDGVVEIQFTASFNAVTSDPAYNYSQIFVAYASPKQ